ncbi:MAG: class I SAM-dependent methyltransferase [Acetivibrionales bacterium]|jgi:ubiquinone/menaquinone biosynthesis C-methylase UbiE
MSKVEEKLAKSLTAETTELIPFFPYLLQDLWELGAMPKEIIELMQKHLQVSQRTSVLDLACGKGAVSVHVAKTFGCKVKGIDIIPDFISCARKKAEEYLVDNICEFEVNDINQSVENEKGFDVVILGAVGDVLGNPEETILKLKKTVKQHGFMLIDDAYSASGKNNKYPSREQWLKVFKQAGVKYVADKEAYEEELTHINMVNQENITKRANELKAVYPNKSDIFEGYIKSQQKECDELENEITGVLWLLQVI